MKQNFLVPAGTNGNTAPPCCERAINHYYLPRNQFEKTSHDTSTSHWTQSVDFEESFDETENFKLSDSRTTKY